jgi:hypothetical protein
MAEQSPADLIREAMEHLDQPTTPSEIVRYVSKKYAHIDEGKIRSQVTICCVNMPTRVSFPENRTPRTADDPKLDCLYRVDFGQYVLFDPEVYGQWEIAEVDEELVVRKMAGKPPPAKPKRAAPDKEPVPEAKINAKAEPVTAPGEKVEEKPEPPAGEPVAKPLASARAKPGPTAEKQKETPHKPEKEIESAMDIHEALVSNLDDVEDGLKPEPGDPAAGKFPAKLSDEDLLARGKDGALVILKVFVEPPAHQVITDLLVNLGWAHENLKDRKVRAVILAPQFPDELRFAVRTVSDVKLMTYEYRLVFSAVS